jgi:hypothetical protein
MLNTVRPPAGIEKESLVNLNWSELTIGVASVACLFGVVKMFMTYLGNHISKHTAALNNLVVKTEHLADKIDGCPQRKE